VIDSKNNVLWSSGTSSSKSEPNDGATVSVQNDGNVVMYRTTAYNDLNIWSTGTQTGSFACPAPFAQPPVQVTSNGCATIMPAGLVLGSGGTITSPNGLYTVTMQPSGALVLTGAGTLWSSTQTPTYRKATINGPPLPGSSAALTYGNGNNVSDNLVVGTSASKTSFETNTKGGGDNQATPGFSYLAVQNDGNLVLYSPEGVVADWQSGTIQPGATPCPYPGQELASVDGAYY
jgi:hypothetical protein